MYEDDRRLRIPGILDRVATACDFVVEAARRAGLDERAVYHCQLAVDEACTNVIEHGYQMNGAEQAIDILCRKEDGRFSIIISDDSPPFNPLLQADPDPNQAIEDREPGGWGVYFIKKVMDEVFYQHDASRNNLVMVKRMNERVKDSKVREHQPRMVSAVAPMPGLWVVTPHGRMDGDLSKNVEQIIHAKGQEGSRAFILDMSDVDYVSSAGLKVLVRLWQQIGEAGGHLLLAGLHARVREVLEIVGLDMVFTVYETVESAISDYRIAP